MIIKDEFELFICSKEGQICAKTIKSYWSHYNALKKYFNENEELTKPVCQNLYKSVLQSKTIAEYTKYSYLKSWKAFIRWTGEDLPCPVIRKIDTPPKDIYTDEEIKILTTKPAKHNFSNIRGWAITCLLCSTGIRSASLRNIKPEDIDWDRKYIVLNHTKNRKRMTVKFDETTYVAMKYLQKFGEYEYFFTNEFGEQLSESALRTLVERYNKKHNITKTSLHCYRHYFACAYLKQTNNLIGLKRLLGHSSVAVTENYLKNYLIDLDNIYESPINNLSKKKVTYIKH